MQNLGYLIHLTSKLLKHDLNTRLEPMNFTAIQWAVIKDLELCEERKAPADHFTAASIAKRLDMDKPTISGILNRLDEKGFIVRKANPEDKRSQIIELSEQCRKASASLQALSNETLEHALKNFKEHECKALTFYLERIVKNLREIEKCQTRYW